MTPCALSFAAPDERPRSIVLAGTRYATESLMRCSRCGRLVGAHESIMGHLRERAPLPGGAR